MINCTYSKTCTLECWETLGCYGLMISAPQNNTLSIICDADNSCSGITVNGGIQSGADIDIDCDGVGMCWQSAFNGTGTISSCQGQDACFETVFPEPPSKTNYQLSCIGQRACKDAAITCPEEATCKIVCDGQDACNNTLVIPPIGDEIENATLICYNATNGIIACNETGITFLNTTTTESETNYKGMGALVAFLIIFMIATCAWLCISYSVVYVKGDNENISNNDSE